MQIKKWNEWTNKKKTFIKNYIEKYKMLLYLQPEIRKCWEFFFTFE